MIRKLGVLTVAALVLAGCGKATQASDNAVQVNMVVDAHALAESADHTARAGTGKVDLTMNMGLGAAPATGGSRSKGGSGGTSAFSVTGHGVYDTGTKQSSMTIDLGSMLGSLPATTKGSIPEMGNGTEEVVQVGPVTYLRMPMLTAVMPGVGDKWIRFDSEQLKAVSGSSSSGPLGMNGFGDPSAILGYLKGAGADVTTVGHEQINGVDTTHAHATLSMRQALDAAGADRDKIGESLKNMPGQTADAIENLSFPVDVFIDADGYVRRISISYDFGSMFDNPRSAKTPGGTAPSGGSGMSLAMTLDYHDFGQPVSIVVPSDDDSMSLCDVYALAPAKTRGTLPNGLC